MARWLRFCLFLRLTLKISPLAAPSVVCYVSRDSLSGYDLLLQFWVPSAKIFSCSLQDAKLVQLRVSRGYSARFQAKIAAKAEVFSAIDLEN